MKPLLAVLLAAWLAHPARAAEPHAGHSAEPAPQDPHAIHGAQDDAAGAQAGPEADEPAEGPHAGHRSEQPPPPEAPPPAAAYSGPRHAADLLFDRAAMERAREGLHHEHGGMRTSAALVDHLEAPLESGRDAYAWDAQGWHGGDLNKLWIKTEGEGRFGGRAEKAELQALWSRAFTPWFDVQAGVRYDFRPEPERAHLVLGVQGLMPYRFEVDAAAFLSERGDVSARLEAEYELLITQRLILEPRAEIEAAMQDVPGVGIGSGIGELELGLRLRYEIAREVAPYIGLQWERSFGETADFAREAGEDTSDLFLVAGVAVRF